MIGKNRLLIENIVVEVKKLKDSESRGALQNHILKVELALNLSKNDLQ